MIPERCGLVPRLRESIGGCDRPPTRRDMVGIPLQVWICEDCGLAQFGYVVASEILYQNISSLMSRLLLETEDKHVQE